MECASFCFYVYEERLQSIFKMTAFELEQAKYEKKCGGYGFMARTVNLTTTHFA